MNARIIVTRGISGQRLRSPLFKAPLLASLVFRAIRTMGRKLLGQNPAQALAHARIKAELEDRHARNGFGRGGPR